MNVSLFSALRALMLVVCCVASASAVDDKAKPAAKPKPKPTVTAAPAGPKPTEANVPYGKHPKQVIDFYQAESKEPTPVVFYIHGGGWRGGSKNNYNPIAFLREGISVVAVEYRFVDEAAADGVEPPVKGPLHDAARALQFVRSKAKEWNLDKTRIAATGGSAGASSSLWLAFHDDLADPKSEDPIARESTRLLAAAVIGAQTSLDPKQMKEWMPNSKYGSHAFLPLDGNKRAQSFEAFLEKRDQLLPLIKEYSPYELVTSDDPAIGLYYGPPPAMGKETPDPTHSANFGLGLQEKCKSSGVECELIYKGAADVKHETAADFLISKLKAIK